MEFMHTKEERSGILEWAFRVFASTQEDRIEENESRAAATHARSEGADSPCYGLGRAPWNRGILALVIDGRHFS